MNRQVKNCSNCGSTNPVDAHACMLCNHTTFYAAHQPIGNVDGVKVTDEAKPEVVVVVVEESLAK